MCKKIVWASFRTRRVCKRKGGYGPKKEYCKMHAKYFNKRAQIKFPFLEEDQGLK